MLIHMQNPYNTRHQFIAYPKNQHEFARKTCIYQLIDLVNYPPEDTNLPMNTSMVNTHSLQGFVFYHTPKTLWLRCMLNNWLLCVSHMLIISLNYLLFVSSIIFSPTLSCVPEVSLNILVQTTHNFIFIFCTLHLHLCK